MMRLRVQKYGFWWTSRYALNSETGILLYQCRREFRNLAYRWHVRDKHGADLLQLHNLNFFQLADGRRRSVEWAAGIWAVDKKVISGDQCEDLLVEFQGFLSTWQIATSHQQPVAAAKRMLYGWRMGYEIDIYRTEFLEEVIAFAILFDLGRN